MRAAVLAAGLCAALGPAPARAGEAGEARLRDFLVQDVCLGPDGAVLAGRTPLDGPALCPAERDLEPGERLPYHKHDHPSPDQRRDAPLGYQRHDSVPVATAGFGVAVEHSFDFGPGGGKRFGVFDPGSDGGDIVVLSPGAAAIAATEGGGGPFGFWVGPCSGGLTAAALAHSWLVAEFAPAGGSPLQGETVARLNGVKADAPPVCPSRYNAAYTRWREAPFRYRAAPGQGQPVTLTSLVSEHYGGADPGTADHVERFYFTRELGGTRWERWQNAAGNSRFSAATVAARAAWFAGTGRCGASPPPAGAPMLLIDCREWTQLVPAAEAAGDAPGFFLESIRARAEPPPFFARPAEHR